MDEYSRWTKTNWCKSLIMAGMEVCNLGTIDALGDLIIVRSLS